MESCKLLRNLVKLVRVDMIVRSYEDTVRWYGDNVKFQGDGVRLRDAN